MTCHYLLTPFHVAYLCGELFVGHLHVDEHVLEAVVVEYFEGVVGLAETAVEVLVAETAAGELVEIVVVAFVEIVVVEIAAVQQIAVDYLAETVVVALEVALVETGADLAALDIDQDLLLEELSVDHKLTVSIVQD